jgi:murein DD-endopeptidase MepM/ murein hydrolase activator NlpD
MMQCRWFVLGLGFSGLMIPGANAQVPSCPKPALERVVQHTIASGDTIESIATRYNLIPATLMGFNPSLRSGTAQPGTKIQIPPFNGIRVEVPPGQSWKDVATRFKIRPDVLYEVNGCQRSPQIVFVPGVNWSPLGEGRAPSATANPGILTGSPLPKTSSLLLGYGWYVVEGQQNPIFHSGIDLAAAIGTPVQAVGDGTVAFAGTQGAYGNLVVINHARGYQTRYAQLSKIQVKVGQTVKKGAAIALVGQSGAPSLRQPHLHFEVRSNSKLGWVAEDPSPFLRIRN